MNAKVNEKADMILHGRASEEFTIKAVEAAAKRSGNPAGFLRAVLRQIALYERDSVWNSSERIDAIKDVLLSLVDDYEVNSVEANVEEEKQNRERKLRTFFDCVLGKNEEQRKKRYVALVGYLQGKQGVKASRILRKAMKEKWLEKDVGRGEMLRLAEAEEFDWSENTVENIFKTMHDCLTTKDEYYVSSLDFSEV